MTITIKEINGKSWRGIYKKYRMEYTTEGGTPIIAIKKSLYLAKKYCTTKGYDYKLEKGCCV